MKHVYMSMTITRFDGRPIEPLCEFYDGTDTDEVLTQVDYETACRLFWELRLAGGNMTVRTNEFDKTITISRVVYSVVWFE